MKTELTNSKDGTAIAFERSGDGAPVVLVDGALCYRAFGPSRKVAEALTPRFTVYTYDRRGRGESGDTAPHAVEREVEDLEAVIEQAGGEAHVCGFSSGAALVLEAARRGASITSLALYEPPFIVDDSRAPIGRDYTSRLESLLAADRRAAAVKLFMSEVGMPRILLAVMPVMPAWSKLKGVAHTLPYDAAIMGDTQAGKPLPTDRWAAVGPSTLVMVGGKSPAWMQNGTQQLSDRLPTGRRAVLEGQTHMVKAKALGPVLTEYYGNPSR